jgi:hypothetical protein
MQCTERRAVFKPQLEGLQGEYATVNQLHGTCSTPSTVLALYTYTHLLDQTGSGKN